MRSTERGEKLPGRNRDRKKTEVGANSGARDRAAITFIAMQWSCTILALLADFLCFQFKQSGSTLPNRLPFTSAFFHHKQLFSLLWSINTDEWQKEQKYTEQSHSRRHTADKRRNHGGLTVLKNKVGMSICRQRRNSDFLLFHVAGRARQTPVQGYWKC